MTLTLVTEIAQLTPACAVYLARSVKGAIPYTQVSCPCQIKCNSMTQILYTLFANLLYFNSGHRI